VDAVGVERFCVILNAVKDPEEIARPQPIGSFSPCLSSRGSCPGGPTFATTSSSWVVSLTTQEATLSGAPVSPDGRAFPMRTALCTYRPRANLNPEAPNNEPRQKQALLRRQPRSPARLHPRPVRRPHLPRPALQLPSGLQRPLRRERRHRSASQITAFKDTWEWNEEAARSYEEVIEQGGRVADAMRAFRTLLTGSDMLAYLAMMAPRLVELRRVLKETGSIYLHCDPTASHYLKGINLLG
jgi:hypothetical protein